MIRFFTCSMKTHVLGISGSHRNGNTDFMVQLCLEQLKQKGYQTIFLNLKEKNIGFCNAEDYYCKLTQGCTCCRDDMTEIYKVLEQSDIIIFGSPTYFANVSGRMKTFMDRCSPYWFNKKLNDKRAYLMGVGGSPEKYILQMLDRFVLFVEAGLGMKIIDRYFIRAEEADAVSKNEKAILDIKAFAKRIS